MNIQKKLTIAVAGNPNSGKSTIFNAITAEKQHIGNYPGVTVDIKTGTVIHADCELSFVDLPGTYSLTANSPEELIARNFILEQKPSLVLVILDSTNLERQLYLALQILELGVPAVFAFNKTDEAVKNNIKIDYQKISDILGVDAVATTGTTGEGISDLLDLICSHSFQPVNTQLDFGENIENAINSLCAYMTNLYKVKVRASQRWQAIKLLENDEHVFDFIDKINTPETQQLLRSAKSSQEKLKAQYKTEPKLIIIQQRYKQIEEIIAETVVTEQAQKTTKSDKIDKILTNKFIGLPFFFLVMWCLFQFTFTVGEPLMNLIGQGQDVLINFVDGNFVDGWFKSLICDGVLSGVGAVISFLPNIFLLFLGIAILEFSGYITRAAFVMDKIMQKIGLQGKSFVPMIIGFGCSVPAIMATRTLEDKKDRILTMMIIPFMSCGAKLPIYILFAGAFFPESAGTVIFIIYVIGILISILGAFILRRLIFKGEPSSMILELPSYKFPRPGLILKQAGYRGWLYLRKAGTIILVAVIVLWIMLNFPGASANELMAFEDNIAQAELKIEQVKTDDKSAGSKAENKSVPLDKGDRNEASAKFQGVNSLDFKAEIAELEAEIQQNEHRIAGINLESTIGGQIGKGIGFLLTPAGLDDWRLGTALFAGLTAKEVVVSTLGTLYSMGSDEGEDSEKLQSAIKNDVDADGKQVFTPLIGFSLMIFVLLYSPCLAAVAVVRAETGKWKWTFFFIIFTTLVAFIASTLTYQIGSLII